MLYFKKNTFFRKIKVDGCTIAHISVEDHRPQEISEKEFHETRKDDRAKPLHIISTPSTVLAYWGGMRCTGMLATRLNCFSGFVTFAKNLAVFWL